MAIDRMRRFAGPLAVLALAVLIAAMIPATGLAASSPAEQAAAASAAAVADPGRPAADRDADPARKPAETLAFAQVAPGQVVVDFFPGGGYFTRLLSAAVGPGGRVYAFVPAELAAIVNHPLPTTGARPDPSRPNITTLVAPAAAFATPEPVDLVFTAQNYHDLHDPFMGPVDIAAFNGAVFAALKRGGLYLVLDHAAAAGSGLTATNTLHRIDEATVRREAEAAGFVLVGESRVLRNAADDHSRPVFDPVIRHHTDQFILLFRKP